MPIQKTYKLFISHALEMHEDYAKLLEMLDTALSFSYAPYSVPVDARYRKMPKAMLEENIRKQIRPVNCVLVLDSVYKSNNEWVKFELDSAVAQRKPIIGIREWKSKEISCVIADVAIEIVGWNPKSIASAIGEFSVKEIRPMLYR